MKVKNFKLLKKKEEKKKRAIKDARFLYLAKAAPDLCTRLA